MPTRASFSRFRCACSSRVQRVVYLFRRWPSVVHRFLCSYSLRLRLGRLSPLKTMNRRCGRVSGRTKASGAVKTRHLVAQRRCVARGPGHGRTELHPLGPLGHGAPPRDRTSTGGALHHRGVSLPRGRLRRRVIGFPQGCPEGALSQGCPYVRYMQLSPKAARAKRSIRALVYVTCE